MKKIVFTAAIVCFAAIATTVTAQDDKVTIKEKKNVQEIVIRKKGEKDTKIVVEIKGDNVTINGKPLSEYKDDEITINRRNMTIRDGQGKTRMTFTPEDFGGMNFWNDADGSGAFLGVTTNEVNDESKEKGAKITNVTKESAAEKAGLKNGDVITKINDKKVEDPESLSDVVTSFKPKDEVTVYYIRDGAAGSAKAILGERKGSSAMAYSFSGPDGLSRSFTIPKVEGVPNVDVSPRVWTPGSGSADNFQFFNDNTYTFPRQQKLGLKIQDTNDGNGVKVLDVDKDSPADKAGLKKDDVVTEIGGKKVSNTDEVREQLQENMEKSTYNIKATRNGSAMSFDIKIEKKLKTANL